VAGLDCGAPLQAAPAGSNEPEARADYETTIAAADPSALPELIDTSMLSDLERAWLGYALVIEPESLRTSLSRADLPTSDLGVAVAAALALGPPGGIDFVLLRQALHRHYACDRGLPSTREAFVDLYGDYTSWSRRDIALSIPKARPRVLYENAPAGVYVAETDTDDAGAETEVILAGSRPDGALEFFGYGPEGDLLGWAELAVGSVPEPLPLPLTCALCHRDLTANTFSVIDPS
jgi:hypothetical protein